MENGISKDGIFDWIEIAATEGRYASVEVHALNLLQNLDNDPQTDPHMIEQALAILAAARQFGGKNQEADETFAQLVKLQEDLHGPNTLELGLTLRDWGNALFERNEYDRAEATLRRAADIIERHINRTLFNYGNTLDSLSVCLRETGRLDEALNSAERAVGIIEASVKSSEDLSLVLPLKNLQIILQALGHDQELIKKVESRIKKITDEFEERWCHNRQ